MGELVSTDEELAAWQAGMPGRRRVAWVLAKEGRTIAPVGEYWFAREGGREVARHRFLSGLVDLLESP